jgi:hypothetical protein
MVMGRHGQTFFYFFYFFAGVCPPALT